MKLKKSVKWFISAVILMILWYITLLIAFRPTTNQEPTPSERELEIYESIK